MMTKFEVNSGIKSINKLLSFEGKSSSVVLSLFVCRRSYYFCLLKIDNELKLLLDRSCQMMEEFEVIRLILSSAQKLKKFWL